MKGVDHTDSIPVSQESGCNPYPASSLGCLSYVLLIDLIKACTKAVLNGVGTVSQMLIFYMPTDAHDSLLTRYLGEEAACSVAVFSCIPSACRTR